MASGWYGPALKNFFDKKIDYDTDTIKAQLTQSSYTPTFDTDDALDDVSASKVTGTTDQTLGSKVINVDTSNDEVELQCGTPLTWSSVGPSPAEDTDCVIFYLDSGTPSTSYLIAYCEFTELTTNGSDIQITVPAEGFAKVAY